MTTTSLPPIDSIEELAHFWDTHDLTESEDDLEEVVGSVFAQETAVTLRLLPEEAQAVKKLAESLGISDTDIIHQWVREKLQTA